MKLSNAGFQAFHNAHHESNPTMHNDDIRMNSCPLTPLSNKTTPTLQGRKRLMFESLSESTKNKQSQKLAREIPLENLLRSTEKVARRLKNPCVAKMLKLLKSGGEVWAKSALSSIERVKNSKNYLLTHP